MKLNVAVVDSGTNLVACQRMDGAQLASFAVSEHKARAYTLTLDGIVASRGGIPQDEVACKAAAATIK